MHRDGQIAHMAEKEKEMNIKQLRKERGLTVQELADKAGLSKRTVEDAIRRDACSVGTAIKLADALEVTLDELCRSEAKESKE